MSEKVYEITHPYFGDSEPVTEEQVEEMVNNWEEIEGWNYIVEVIRNEVRVYAYLRVDLDDSTSSPGSDWEKVTSDAYYIVAGKEIE